VLVGVGVRGGGGGKERFRSRATVLNRERGPSREKIMREGEPTEKLNQKKEGKGGVPAERNCSSGISSGGGT